MWDKAELVVFPVRTQARLTRICELIAVLRQMMSHHTREFMAPAQRTGALSAW